MRLNPKKFSFCIVIFLLVLAAAGCKKAEPQDITYQTDPTHIYEEVREDILIDADVIRPEGNAVPKVYVAEHAVISKESINTFLEICNDGVTSVIRDQTKDGIYCYTAETVKGGDISLSISQDKNNARCTFAYYVAENNEYYDNLVIGARRDRSQSYVVSTAADLFSEAKDFSFATAQNAEAEVKEALTALNLHNIILENTFYLDHKILQQAEQERLEDLKEVFELAGETYSPRDWTEADDCYQFEFCCSVDAITTVESIQETPAYIQYPCYITVRYNETGIILVAAGELWAVGDVAAEPEKIVSASEAMAVVKEKLNGVYLGHDMEVQEIALRYNGVQDQDRWLLSPVWEVLVCEKDVPQWSGDILDVYSYILIDAITGEEL